MNIAIEIVPRVSALEAEPHNGIRQAFSIL